MSALIEQKGYSSNDFVYQIFYLLLYMLRLTSGP
jgi:hypothetical protein